ncbi:crossover junction endodeoxyribonuclease RuvC [bacterium B17]|nr:crossover junction endodeoxyribonuclease RuvC [bacterium B17]
MAGRVTRVLGIDTSLRSTGVGVVIAENNNLSAVEYGAIKTPASRRHSECLKNISNGVEAIIERTKPDAVSIEGAFYCKNVKTSMVLGEARGAAIAVCAKKGLPVYEYAPRKVKKAVVGLGGAEKVQVRRMIVSMLGLDEEPQEDAGDALAIAVCHLHNMSGIAALAPEEI